MRVLTIRRIGSLAHARAPQHACFIRDEHRLVVWSDRVEDLEKTVQEFESKLVHHGAFQTSRSVDSLSAPLIRLPAVFNRTLRQTVRSPTSATLSSRAPTTPGMSAAPSINQFFGSHDRSLDNLNEAGQPEERKLPLIHSYVAVVTRGSPVPSLTSVSHTAESMSA